MCKILQGVTFTKDVHTWT